MGRKQFSLAMRFTLLVVVIIGLTSCGRAAIEGAEAGSKLIDDVAPKFADDLARLGFRTLGPDDLVRVLNPVDDLIKSGKYRQANQLLDNLIKTHGEHPDFMLRKALTVLDDGRPDQATEIVNQTSVGKLSSATDEFTVSSELIDVAQKSKNRYALLDEISERLAFKHHFRSKTPNS